MLKIRTPGARSADDLTLEPNAPPAAGSGPRSASQADATAPAPKPELAYAGTESQLLGRGHANGRLLLGGELVLVTMDGQLAPHNGFLRQRPRRASHFLSLSRPTLLHVWTHPVCQRLRGGTVELVLDHYLAYILLSRQPGIFVGAVPTTYGASALALVYQRQRVVAVADYHNLPKLDEGSRLAADLSSIFADLSREHPGLPVVSLAPLPAGLEGVARHVPAERLFRRVRRARLQADSRRRSPEALLPLALLAAGAGGFGYVQWQAQQELAQARAEFEQARAGLNERAISAPLQLLEQQGAYLREDGPQAAAVASAGELIRNMARVSGVRIDALTRFVSSDPTAPQFQATVVVPAVAGQSLLEQGDALLRALAAATGYELRLQPQGYVAREEQVRGKLVPTRLYTFTGVARASN